MGNDRNAADAEVIETIDDALQDGLAKNIQEAEGDSGELLRVFRTGASDEDDRSHIHVVHLGAAARKSGVREGTHPGILRNREIGSRAFARRYRSKERRYWRMI